MTMPNRIATSHGKHGLAEKLMEISGPDHRWCFQCGLCSGSCPLAHRMDLTPRQIMRRAQLGLMEDLAAANSPWVCSTCDTCLVVCPRGIDIPRVMEALRLAHLRSGRSRLDVQDLAPETLKGCPTIALVAALRKLAS